MEYQTGDTIELLISDYGEGISCFGQLEAGMAVFVDGKTVPGDTVRATVTHVEPRYLNARLESVLTPAPERIEPACPHFSECGGCKWQQIPYELELQLKEKRVRDALEHIGKAQQFDMPPILGAEQAEGYRNKVTFSRDATGAIGYHLPGDPENVLPIDHCLLADETSNELLNACREMNFKKLVIRRSEHSGQYQVLIGNEPVLIPDFPTTAKRHLEEKLLNFTYRVYPEAFFQVNTQQAEHLVRTALKLADPQPGDKILELFCGLGTFSLPFASRSKKLVGFEGSKQAVKDAATNAKQNHLTNCTFHHTNLNKADKQTLNRRMGFTPDIVLTDPPRAGMSDTLCEAIMDLAPPSLIYVSCNPATLARDIERLSQHYTLKTVQPIDLFPRTEHVECVASLRLTTDQQTAGKS